jgi:HSP20 family molecular chaperone IbpA
MALVTGVGPMAVISGVDAMRRAVRLAQQLRDGWVEISPPHAPLTPFEDLECGDATVSPLGTAEAREGEYVLTFEMPGVPKSALKLSVEDDHGRRVLRISGERPVERGREREAAKDAAGAAGKDKAKERAGPLRYERRLLLPSSVNASDVKATFADGLLRVTINKLQRKPQNVAVE